MALFLDTGLDCRVLNQKSVVLYIYLKKKIKKNFYTEKIIMANIGFHLLKP